MRDLTSPKKKKNATEQPENCKIYLLHVQEDECILLEHRVQGEIQSTCSLVYPELQSTWSSG